MSKWNWDADWLIFSARARRGVLIFLLIFVVFGVLKNIFHADQSTTLKVNYFKVVDASPILLDTLYKGKSESGKERSIKTNNPVIPDSLFNPNLLSVDDWRKMGFSEKQTKAIINYKERVGGFKSKRDVQNLYVMNENLYELLQPFIDLPDSIERKKQPNYKPKRRELNTASEKELQWIKGIGPFYAKRITEYRNALGGFYDFGQLAEINQLPHETIERIKDEMDLSRDYILKLNINKLNEADFISHPYIRFSVAKEIVALREKFGKFNSIEQLKSSSLIDAKMYERLKHYLTIDENTGR